MEEENKGKNAPIDSVPQSSEKQKPEPQEPQKSNKGQKIALVVCILLALAGLGFGIYGFFFKKPSSQELIESIKDDTNLEAISSVTDVKELDTKDVIEDKEITITNQYVKDDLNRKISILTGVTDVAKDDVALLNSAFGYTEARNFYSRGFESTTEKAGAVLIGSLSLFTTGDYTEKTDPAGENEYLQQSIKISNFIRNTYSPELLTFSGAGSSYQVISYSLANKIYSSMFNETLPKENINTGICSREFAYISEVDVFLKTPVGGCGGTGYSGILVRKDSYKAKGDEAYVYVKVASTHLADKYGWLVYDDFYEKATAGKEINSTLKIYNGLLQETPANNSFMDAATDYRFVFKKNPTTGTYYFLKLEKL